MASDLITIDQLKSLGVGTLLSDSALEIIVDGEDEWIRHKAGPHDGVIRIVRQTVEDGRIYLSRPARLIGLVQYSYPNLNQWTPVTDVAMDFNGLYITSQILWGLGPRWDVEISFFPVLDTARRRTALIEMVKNTLAYTGNEEMEVPGLETSWKRERQCILRQFDYRTGLA